MVLLYTFQTHLTFAWNFYYLKKKIVLAIVGPPT
jgi:hypothetical protein